MVLPTHSVWYPASRRTPGRDGPSRSILLLFKTDTSPAYGIHVWCHQYGVPGNAQCVAPLLIRHDDEEFWALGHALFLGSKSVMRCSASAVHLLDSSFSEQVSVPVYS